MAKVQILLATYNGEKYLAEQLVSICAQSFKDWNLLVHDDGSTDGTMGILLELQKRDKRVIIIRDGITFRSAAKNFEHLMKLSTAPYVCFCDQDDIWNDDHIIHLLNRIEMGGGQSEPRVVFSDCVVVDENLVTISTSLMSYQRMNAGLAKSLKMLSVRNCVTGCTAIINRAAIDISLPFSDKTRMHDHWVSLCVLKWGGRVLFTPMSTLKYRQHANNAVGAKAGGIIRKITSIRKWRNLSRDTVKNYEQAREVGGVTSVWEFLTLKTISLIAYR